jgi:amino-acid N-acetyltransferase
MPQVGGIRRLYLLTATTQDFFAKHGYAVVPRGSVPEAIQTSTEFMSLCPASAICLHKRLK